MSREIVLDRELIIDLLTDPKFYTACPAFTELEVESYRLERSYRNAPGCCGGRTVVMEPVTLPFVTKLQAALSEDRATVQAVRKFLHDKTHYTNKTIRVYYRHRKTPRQVSRFRF